MTLKALVTEQTSDGMSTVVREVTEDSLGEGSVTVAVEWSTVNFKDGLALAGKRIMQTYPMIGGIDFAGTVETSDDPAFKPGDKVVANGWGLSQTHNGGYSQKVRVPGEWLVRLDDRFSTRDAMAVGTAGYTAMLCVLALERGGITPENGDVLVTGASGGVGSIAISLLSALGYRVVASTGRLSEETYLRHLGASYLIDRSTLSAPGKSLGIERWAAAIDSIGSHTLANVLAQTKYRGVVAACGLAQGMDLPTTVAPFILRNVTLAGIDSVNAPRDVRFLAWERLSRDLNLDKLSATAVEIGLSEVPRVAAAILKGEVRGRTVVNVNS